MLRCGCGSLNRYSRVSQRQRYGLHHQTILSQYQQRYHHHNTIKLKSQRTKNAIILLPIQQTQRFYNLKRFAKQEQPSPSSTNHKEQEHRDDKAKTDFVPEKHSITSYTTLALIFLLISFYYGNPLFTRAGEVEEAADEIESTIEKTVRIQEDEYAVPSEQDEEQRKATLITLCSIAVNYMNWPLILNTGTIERLIDALHEEKDLFVLFHVLRSLATLAENKNIIRDFMETNVSFDALFKILNNYEQLNDPEVETKNSQISKSKIDQIQAYAGDLVTRIVESQMSHYIDFRYDDPEKRYNYKIIIELMRLSTSDNFINRRTGIESLLLLKRHVMSKEMIATLEQTVDAVIDSEAQRRYPDKFVVKNAKKLQQQIAYYKKMQEINNSNKKLPAPPDQHQISSFGVLWRSIAENAILILLGATFWNTVRFRIYYGWNKSSAQNQPKDILEASVHHGKKAIRYAVPYFAASVGGDYFLRHLMVSRPAQSLVDFENYKTPFMSLGIAGSRSLGAYYMFRRTPYFGASVVLPVIVLQDLQFTSSAIGYAWNTEARLLIKRPDRSLLGKIVAPLS